MKLEKLFEISYSSKYPEAVKWNEQRGHCYTNVRPNGVDIRIILSNFTENISNTVSVERINIAFGTYDPNDPDFRNINIQLTGIHRAPTILSQIGDIVKQKINEILSRDNNLFFMLSSRHVDNPNPEKKNEQEKRLDTYNDMLSNFMPNGYKFYGKVKNMQTQGIGILCGPTSLSEKRIREISLALEQSTKWSKI